MPPVGACYITTGDVAAESCLRPLPCANCQDHVRRRETPGLLTDRHDTRQVDQHLAPRPTPTACPDHWHLSNSFVVQQTGGGDPSDGSRRSFRWRSFRRVVEILQTGGGDPSGGDPSDGWWRSFRRVAEILQSGNGDPSDGWWRSFRRVVEILQTGGGDHSVE